MSELERLYRAIRETLHRIHMEAYEEYNIDCDYLAFEVTRDLVANGQRVEWCETHDSPQHGDRKHCQAWYLPTPPAARWCSFGGRLLVDPPKEEQTEIQSILDDGKQRGPRDGGFIADHPVLVDPPKGEGS